KPDVLEAEVIVRGEELSGLGVVFRTGHHVERQRLAEAKATGYDLFGVNLEQAGRRHRPDRRGPLGTLEAGTGTRPTGHDHDRDLARRQRRGADLGKTPPGDPIAVGLGEPENVDRAGVLGRWSGR